MTDEVQTSALKVTLKAGPGYEAPWITVQADDPRELAKYLDAITDVVAPAAVNASQGLQGVYNVAHGLGATVERTERQERTEYRDTTPRDTGGAPDAAPTCVHGPMIRRTSKPGDAKKWGAYFCPQPRTATDKCDPIWDPKK